MGEIRRRVYAWSIAFHWHVGFIKLPVVVFGLLASIFVGYSFILVDRGEFDRFRAKETLHQERTLLQETQTSLHGMLSSVFDASCVCDGGGRLTHHSPQLHHLLNGRDLAGTELWELGSTGEEGD